MNFVWFKEQHTLEKHMIFDGSLGYFSPIHFPVLKTQNPSLHGAEQHREHISYQMQLALGRCPSRTQQELLPGHYTLI